MRGAGVVFGLAVAAFIIRTALVWLLRRSHPEAASFVNRWWVWAPYAVVLVGVTVLLPWVGVLLTVGSIVVLSRAEGVDVPFRRPH